MATEKNHTGIDTYKGVLDALGELQQDPDPLVEGLTFTCANVAHRACQAKRDKVPAAGIRVFGPDGDLKLYCSKCDFNERTAYERLHGERVKSHPLISKLEMEWAKDKARVPLMALLANPKNGRTEEEVAELSQLKISQLLAIEPDAGGVIASDRARFNSARKAYGEATKAYKACEAKAKELGLSLKDCRSWEPERLGEVFGQYQTAMKVFMASLGNKVLVFNRVERKPDFPHLDMYLIRVFYPKINESRYFILNRIWSMAASDLLLLRHQSNCRVFPELPDRQYLDLCKYGRDPRTRKPWNPESAKAFFFFTRISLYQGVTVMKRRLDARAGRKAKGRLSKEQGIEEAIARQKAALEPKSKAVLVEDAGKSDALKVALKKAGVVKNEPKASVKKTAKPKAPAKKATKPKASASA